MTELDDAAFDDLGFDATSLDVGPLDVDSLNVESLDALTPGEAPGGRKDFLLVTVAAGFSLIAAFWFPPAGVVLFMGTTVLAARRFRQMPFTVIVLAIAAVLSALATPSSVLSSSLTGTGTSVQHVAKLAPAPRPSR
jgi:hypothetical protein